MQRMTKGWAPEEVMELGAAATDDARSISILHIARWRASYEDRMPDAVLEGINLE